MHVIDLHRRTVDQFAALLDDIAAEHWNRPTPCTDWDVRALVNHVVGEDLWTVPLMDGATIEEVGDRFEGDLLGDDPVATGHAACEAAVPAVASGVVAGRTVHLSFGDTPAEEYAYQLATDHLIHAWDLAAAIGADRRLDPEAVDACAAWFADREELYRQAGVIAQRPPVDAAGDPQSRLLLGFGRDPGWEPGTGS